MITNTCSKIAGSYTATYQPHEDLIFPSNAIYLGRTGPEGISITNTNHFDTITGDQYGPGTAIDGFSTGRETQLEFVLQNLGLVDLNKFLFPWDTYDEEDSGAYKTGLQNLVPQTGQLISQVAGKLTLTSIPGSSASEAFKTDADTQDIMQFFGVVVGPLQENYSSELRVLPVIFKCFPVFDSGDTKALKMYNKFLALSP